MASLMRMQQLQQQHDRHQAPAAGSDGGIKRVAPVSAFPGVAADAAGGMPVRAFCRKPLPHPLNSLSLSS